MADSTPGSAIKGARSAAEDRGLDSAPCHHAHDLMQGGTVAAIFLDDKRYALRITRQRKLILTK